MSANIDGYVSSIVTPGLQPGESVMGSAHVRRSLGGDYNTHEEYICVATDRRLVMFRTEVTGVGLFTVLPKNLGVVEWWYQDLDQVGVRDMGKGVVSVAEMAIASIGGPMRILRLRAYDGLRPTNNDDEIYVIPRDTTGLSGQAQFHAQFAAWLLPRVNGRTFPLTPDRQQFHAQRQQQRAAADASRRAAAAATRGMMKRLAPYFLALVPLTSALVGVIALGNATRGIESSDRVLASPAGQEPGIRATYEADKERYQGRVPTTAAWIVASLLATGGAVFWAWRRNARAAGG